MTREEIERAVRLDGTLISWSDKQVVDIVLKMVRRHNEEIEDKALAQGMFFGPSSVREVKP